MFKRNMRMWYSAVAEYEKTAAKINKDIKNNLKKKKVTNAEALQIKDEAG